MVNLRLQERPPSRLTLTKEAGWQGFPLAARNKKTARDSPGGLILNSLFSNFYFIKSHRRVAPGAITKSARHNAASPFGAFARKGVSIPAIHPYPPS